MTRHLRALHAFELLVCAALLATVAVGALAYLGAKDAAADDLDIVVGAFLVALASGVLSLGLLSPCGELETAGSRNVSLRAVAFYCVAVAVTSGVLVACAAPDEGSSATILRGAVGAGALGIVGAVVIGPGVGWAVPMLGVLAPMILDQLGASLGVLAWYTRPADSVAAWTGVLLMAGAAALLVANRGLKPAHQR